MPDPVTKKKAERDLAQGKAPSTAAGEFVREEIHHIRGGKHGAKNTKQAIAIGLSKARRAGIDVQPGDSASPSTRRKAAQDRARAGKPKNPRRARASAAARRRESASSVSTPALSRQARSSAERRRKARGRTSPTATARRAARTRKSRQGANARSARP